MKKTLTAVVLAMVATAVVMSHWRKESSSMADEKADGKMLVHNVFFQLKDDSDAATQRLVDACYKYLKDHPGVVFFAAGPLVKELDRPVNVRDFQVGLHVVFKTKKAHDDYQVAPTHLKFIEENKDTWQSVRVFDTYAAR